MIKWLRHMIVLVMLFSIMQVRAQIAMPDTVCAGTTRLYHVNDATTPSTYTWKIDGVTQPGMAYQVNVNWTTPGTYLLTVQEHTAGGCDGDIRSGLVYVSPVPIANAGADITSCFGTNPRLNGNGGNFYQWSSSTYLSNPSVPNPTILSPPPGVLKYVLNVTNKGGCKSLTSDTVVVTILPPVKIFAGNDTAVPINQPLQLNTINTGNNGALTYSWSPSFGLNNSSIKDPVALPARDITYTVTARTIEGCEGKDDISIKVFSHADIYVPTAFTPDKNGTNDVFRPILKGVVLKFFSVYNRFGQLVFSTTKEGDGWDGTINGQSQGSGAFVWFAEAVDYKGNHLSRKGMVVLLR
jgi:gliding motility-associated-like protein